MRARACVCVCVCVRRAPCLRLSAFVRLCTYMSVYKYALHYDRFDDDDDDEDWEESASSYADVIGNAVQLKSEYMSM